MDFFQNLFETDFMPHGHCYFWRPEILWPHVLGDVFTAISYFVIPFLLYRFVKARPDVKYPGVFIAFSLFILCCGITHLLATVSVHETSVSWRVRGTLTLGGGEELEISQRVTVRGSA